MTLECRCATQWLEEHARHAPGCPRSTYRDTPTNTAPSPLTRELARLHALIRGHVDWVFRMAALPPGEWDGPRLSALREGAETLLARATATIRVRDVDEDEVPA